MIGFIRRSFWTMCATGVATLLTFGSTSFAQTAPATTTAPAAAVLDTGSVSWLLTSALLVCFMIPGLAMFYGGMVRAKNVLNTMLACIAPIGLIGFMWVAFGYAMVFPVVAAEPDGTVKPSYVHFDSSLIFLKSLGNPEAYGNFLTSGDTVGAAPTGVPELAFFCFQGMFAIITPALIFGAVAERVRFGPLMLFYAIWAVVVYNPVAHWVWNPAGWLFQKGVMDFAGGTVVHVLAGVSGLALCLVVGKRRGYDGKTPIQPHNLGMTLLGAGFLMVGWFGFNAGSAIGVPGTDLPVAGKVAVLAFTTTFVAAASAALVWMLIEWAITKKPTALGVASGLVAGLVAITPCAGHVTPASACLIGALGGLVCFFGCRIKYKLGFDDSLDAFGVHGIGGFLGALLVGIFAFRPGPGGWEQFGNQLLGASTAAIYCFVVTFIIGLIIHKTIGFRVKPEVEDEGIDINMHGEEGYKFNS